MTDLAGDLLRGAGAIAEEVLGSRSQKNKRKIYHMHEHRQLPTWMEGNQIISTRSAIRQHYSDKQRAAAAAANSTT